jgi:hypothetical protein
MKKLTLGLLGASSALGGTVNASEKFTSLVVHV